MRPTMAPHHSGLKNYHQRLNRESRPEAPANHAHTSLTAKRSIHDRVPAICMRRTLGDAQIAGGCHPRVAGATERPTAAAPA